MNEQRGKAFKLSVLNSLKVRLIASALLLILVLMPLIGFTLNDAFKLQIKSALKNELSAYLYSVLASTEVDNNQLLMPEQLLENQFNVIQSGLYALISIAKADYSSATEKAGQLASKSNQAAFAIAWHSDSFLGLPLPSELPHPATGKSEFSEMVLAGKGYFIYSLSVSFAQSGNVNEQFPITIHILKDQADFQQQAEQFSRQLWKWLLILMVLLVVVQSVWLLWTLKPLASFTRELSDIEHGRAKQLAEIYPTELQAVARQLNTLLNTEQSQRKRYRNALADLAHSLKTPLAVIRSQKGLSQAVSEQISIINNIIGHQLKRAQTAAGSSWYLGVKITSVADKLVRSLAKIYREPQIVIEQNVDQQAVFKGDEADLMEILGNVLDNACKAAKSQVLLTVSAAEGCLVIMVEDDGKGISAQQRTQIFERGMRADSYQQGHGIGLAIVRDLVASYHGQLSVAQSEKLGGAKFKFSFKL